jgi:hypothetical protein
MYFRLADMKLWALMVIMALGTTAIHADDAATIAVSHGLGLVPAAIICSNLQNWQIAVDSYNERQTEVMQDYYTRGQSKLARGEPAPPPDLQALGCTMIPNGTRLIVTFEGAFPVVTAKLRNGKTVRGVMHPDMFTIQK